jgi:hypothetical protein
MVTELDVRAVVLVEGISDRVALEALAERQGRDLEADGIRIVPMGGAQAIGKALLRFRRDGPDLVLAGLCDAGEERHYRRALERAGLGSRLTREGMESLGFFVCERDLEDELVRALGVEAVQEILEAQGELASFRTYQKQPAHRDSPTEDQVWGFMWNRKLRYARLLVEALDLDAMPRPLVGVLAHG